MNQRSLIVRTLTVAAVLRCLGLALPAANTTITPSLEGVANPIVTAKPANAVPGDPSHDYPFLATNADLASHG